MQVACIQRKYVVDAMSLHQNGQCLVQCLGRGDNPETTDVIDFNKARILTVQMVFSYALRVFVHNGEDLQVHKCTIRQILNEYGYTNDAATDITDGKSESWICGVKQTIEMYLLSDRLRRLNDRMLRFISRNLL